MLNERYLERYADVLIWGLKTARRERFRKGETILIQYDRAESISFKWVRESGAWR